MQRPGYPEVDVLTARTLISWDDMATMDMARQPLAITRVYHLEAAGID